MLTLAATDTRYVIPFADMEEFNGPQTGPENRERIRQHLAAFAELERLLGQGIAIRHAAAKIASRMHGRGWSTKAIQDKYRAYRQAGYDWRSLKANYHCGSDRLSLPAEALPQFRSFWTSYVAQTKRADGVEGVYRDMLSRWYRNELSLPGYGTHEQWHRQQYPHRDYRPVVIPRPGDVPRGLSLPNLRRLLPRRQYDRALMRTGFHDAHTHTPDQLLRDVSQLGFMQYIVFDDIRFDIQVVAKNEAGKKVVAYATGLVAIDLASRCVLHCGIKPRLKRDDDTHMGLCREDMQLLVLGLIERWGLPESHNVTLLVENAAAALSNNAEQGLLRTFGNRVTVDRTRMYERELLTNGWREKGGQPWDKAWIESFFRVLNCQLASLPGTTGNRYDNNPGELPARIRETERLLSIVDTAQGQLSDFALPLLTEAQFHGQLYRAFDVLHLRTRHALQGFCTVDEWQAQDGSWHPAEDLMHLPEDSRCGIELHSRMECPAERLHRLKAAANMQPVPVSLYAHLYRAQQAVTCRNGKYVWRIKNGDDLIFRDGAHTLCDRHYEGRTLRGYLADDSSMLHLCDEHDQYLGSIARQARVDYSDRTAILKASGEAHRAREADLGALRSVLSDTAAARRLDHLTNTVAAARLQPQATPSIAQAMQSAERTRKATPQRDPLYDAPKGQAASLAAAAEAARQAVLEDDDTF